VGAVEDGRFGGIDLSPWAQFDALTWTVYPLLFHLLDVAAVVFELWDRFLTQAQRAVIADGLGVDEGSARSLAAFLASAHDLGKLIPYFQRQEAAAWARLGEDLVAQAGNPVEIPHERASLHIVLGLLAEIGFPVQGNDSAAVRGAQVAGGHRGHFPQVDVHGAAAPARVAVVLGGPVWQDLRRRYLALLRHLTGALEVPARMTVPATVLITGLGMVADRLASERGHWLANAHAPAFGAVEHYALACEQARGLVTRSGLERVLLEEVPFAVAHHNLVAPNDLQASLLAQLPSLAGALGAGILAVTDATGAGKSVAALEAARMLNAACGTNGVAWLLPTTATADAAWQDLEHWVAAHRPPHAPVVLAHSHSWLNAAYTDQQLEHPDPAGLEVYARAPHDDHDPDADADAGPDEGPDGEGAGERGAGRGGPRRRSTAPDLSLRGADAALLAQFFAATIDQVLMAVLPVRFNALRLLALSGRTVVIDEAHALAPFTQLQLLRLLNWLGALGCPVVLLSATMPASTSQDLVRAYLVGAGRTGRQLEGLALAPAYPGWLFADAATGTAHCIGEAARRAHAAAQHRTVKVRTREVVRLRLGDAGRTVEPGERLAAIRDLVGPVAHGGGVGAVACATVPDAQDAYRYLKQTWPGEVADLLLLHARFPGHVREERERHLRTALGRSGERPKRLVVVTTSLLDTSLDIDVDVMVSDLASIARLLQRLGRLARFQHAWADQSGRRPAWWDPKASPAMTVLHPVGAHGRTAVPPGWRAVEPAFLLHATAALLPALAGADLALPGQVQGLVEQVHGTGSQFAAATAELSRLLAAHQVRTLEQEQLSAVHLVPAPARVSSLADLHRQYLTTGQAATRLGTRLRRLLPCYRTVDGDLALDRAGVLRLPHGPRLQARQVRLILQHTLPVPAAWVARRTAGSRPPAAWSTHPRLADLVLLPAAATGDHQFQAFGPHLLRMDDELGLVHEQLS